VTALAGGTHVLGPDQGSLTVLTRRKGAAAMVGHDLTLAATRWKATVVVNEQTPSQSKVNATVDATSLEVLQGEGGLTALTDGQKAEIGDIIRKAVLRTGRHPSISFTSTRVDGDGDRGTVTGDLTMVGRTRPCALAVVVSGRSGAAARVTATTMITQTDFGIKPYSTFLGTLRADDVVEVTVKVRLPVAVE
jgi:polyisoprenoid-binding protein YceI